jgi:hypothetical protein
LIKSSQGDGDDNDDDAAEVRSTDAAALLFAKSWGKVVLRSVAVDKLLFSSLFPYVSRLTIGCCMSAQRSSPSTRR